MLHACFKPIAICFVYTSWHFYAFFGTDLLTRCHSASSCFLLFLYFRKAVKEIFSQLDENQRRSLFHRHVHGVQRRDGGGAASQPQHGVAWPHPLAPWGGVGPTGVSSRRPFAYLFLPTRKPIIPEPLSTKSFRDTAAVNPSSGGFRSSSRHPAGEGNHHRRALHHHACLRSDA